MGRHVEYAESLAEQSTASTTYVDAATLAFTPKANTAYAVIATAVIRTGDTNQDVLARLRHDTGATTANESNVENRNSTDYTPFHALDFFTAGPSPSEQTWSLEYATETSATAYVLYARIVAIELGANDLTDSEVTEASSTSSTPTVQASVTTGAGEWLLVACFDGKNDAGAQILEVDLDAAGTLYEADLRANKDNTSWRSQMMLARHTGAGTHNVQFASSNNTDTVRVRNVRLLALKLDDWSDYSDTLTADNTAGYTGSAYTNGYTHTATPAARPYLLLAGGAWKQGTGNVGGSRVTPDAGSTVTTVRVLAANSGGDVLTHVAAWKETLTASETTWAVQYRSDGSDTVTGHWGGVILLDPTDVLAVQDATHTHTADNVELQAAIALDVADVLHSHSAASPTLTQQHVLAVDSCTHGHAADSPALTQAHTLTVADAAHGHATDSPTLTQAHVLDPADGEHAQSAASPPLAQHHALVADDATHAHTADNVELTASATLEVADTTHGHGVDSPALTQAHALDVADGVHAHSADDVELVADNALAVDSVTHGHSADTVDLTQAHTLAAADSAHAHTAASPTLTQVHGLDVADATHSHAADPPALTQAHTLAPDDGTHAHTAASPPLGQAHDLVVADATHGHVSASPTLVQRHALVVQDASHTHVAGSVAVVQVHVLTVAGASHAHIVDGLLLAQAHTISVEGTVHAQTAAVVVLLGGVAFPVQFDSGRLRRRFAAAGSRRRFAADPPDRRFRSGRLAR